MCCAQLDIRRSDHWSCLISPDAVTMDYRQNRASDARRRRRKRRCPEPDFADIDNRVSESEVSSSEG